MTAFRRDGSDADVRFIQRRLGHVKSETTTIYAEVALIREQQVSSPAAVLRSRKMSNRTGRAISTSHQDSCSVRVERVLGVAPSRVAFVRRAVRRGFPD